MTAFKKHEKSSLDAKAALQKEREEKQKKLDEKRQKEKQEQEKLAKMADSDDRVQELTDEEADKLQKEIDTEKAREAAAHSEKPQEHTPHADGTEKAVRGHYS